MKGNKMAITPQDIEQLTFSPSKHGYDTEEVDNFLDQCAAEVDAMLSKIADLKSRLNSTEQELSTSQARVTELEGDLSEARAKASETVVATPIAIEPEPRRDLGASERQISQVLIVAQQSADNMVAEARSNAEKIRNDADQKAREVIRQALAEKQNELDEIDRLKQSREDFRVEYKKLLQHFMDDADSVFPQSASDRSAQLPVADEYMPASAPAPVADAGAYRQSVSMGQPSASAADDFGDLD